MDFDKDHWGVHGAIWKSEVLLGHSFVCIVKRKEERERGKEGKIQNWCFQIFKDIKKRWQEYTEELYKGDINDPNNHDGVITHLEPDILEDEVK